MCCQLSQAVANPPGQPPLPPAAQLPSHHPVFQPRPFSRSPTWLGMLPPSSPSSDSGDSGPLVSPSVQFMTETFLLSSFLALSQRGFHTLHWIYNCIHRGLLSLGLGSDSVHFAPLQPLHFLIPSSSPLSFPLCISLPTSTKHFYQLPTVNCSVPPTQKLLKVQTWAHQDWLSHFLTAPVSSAQGSCRITIPGST